MTGQLSQMEIYALTRTWIVSAVLRSYILSASVRAPSEAELGAHRGLMMCPRLQVENLDVLMSYVEPRATRRGEAGGGYAGNSIGLQALLDLANAGMASADELLSMFGLLQPYSAGNGRCGRALWMWRILHGRKEEVAALTREAPSPPLLHDTPRQPGRFH
jgi:hypothetical protein